MRAGQPTFRPGRALIAVIVASLLLSYGALELGILAFGEGGLLPLISSRKLRHLEKQGAMTTRGDGRRAASSGATAVYVAHPYFGYLYTPNNTFTQRNPAFGNALVMTSNSEGFVDDEFPAGRQADLVVYALMGGSGAMSWGIESPRDRISTVLQTMLNEHATRARTGKRFRVLNMGLGGFTQYQATQVFFYYASRLDGVIFYAGHNEVAHGQIVMRRDPVRFPLADVLAADRSGSPSKYAIFGLRHEPGELAHRCRAVEPLLWLPLDAGGVAPASCVCSRTSTTRTER